MAENKYLHEFTKGIIKENPTLVTLLGMCPTLAVTTMAKNGLGMGLATTFVLVCSNAVISLLYNSLGLFLSLITVNCIILGRAEAFASKNKLIPSILDGLGNGLGFTLALFAMGSVREILGTGQWMGIDLHLPAPMTIFIMPAGGFFALGCIIALVNKLANRKPPQKIGCGNCPNASACGGCGKEEV